VEGNQKQMTKTIIVTTALILASVKMQAQQSCPVQPTVVRYAGAGMKALAAMGTGPNSNTMFEFAYQNESNREVEAVRFRVQFFDATDSPTSWQEFVSSKKLKPGKHTGTMNNAPFGFENTRLEAYVNRIKFKDGSIWNDDGSKSCRVESAK
jgi:hypothetical protein